MFPVDGLVIRKSEAADIVIPVGGTLVGTSNLYIPEPEVDVAPADQKGT